jgi:hypothetical protein
VGRKGRTTRSLGRPEQKKKGPLALLPQTGKPEVALIRWRHSTRRSWAEVPQRVSKWPSPRPSAVSHRLLPFQLSPVPLCTSKFLCSFLVVRALLLLECVRIGVGRGRKGDLKVDDGLVAGCRDRERSAGQHLPGAHGQRQNGTYTYCAEVCWRSMLRLWKKRVNPLLFSPLNAESEADDETPYKKIVSHQLDETLWRTEARRGRRV